MNWKSIAYLLVIIFAARSLFAQNAEQDNERYYITTNHPDYSEKAQVLATKKLVMSTSKDVYYYWYTAGKILNTQGGYNGNVLDGMYIASYLNNNLKEKGSFVKGVKTGQWVSWFENGKISTITNWNKGLLNGEERKYSDLGVLSQYNSYKEGKLDGVSIVYKDGEVLNKKYKNGQEIIKKVKPVKIKTVKVKDIKPANKKKATDIKKTEVKPQTSLKTKWNNFKAKAKNLFKKKAK